MEQNETSLHNVTGPYCVFISEMERYCIERSFLRHTFDTVWCDGLWVKLWDMAAKVRMWHVIKNMYEASRSAILLEGEKSAAFGVEQGVAQGCSLSPILFSVFINGVLKAVEEAGLGREISSGKRIGEMLFADDFCRCK